MERILITKDIEQRRLGSFFVRDYKSFGLLNFLSSLSVFRYDSVSKMGLNMVGASVIVPDGSDGTDPENPYADGKKMDRFISQK